MAENAKPSKTVGGRGAVATPNIGSNAPGMVSFDEAMKAAIGSRIRVQTTTPQTLEGILYTICSLTSTLAVSTTPTTHHIVPISALVSFTIISLAPSSSQPPAPLAPLKHSALLARANAALERAKEKASRTNKDVSKEAQEIFDALYRQFPGTRWAGKDMVVLDAVLIKGPGYRSEDCKAGKGGEGAVGRVKKVLENERRRITQRDQKPVKPVIPAIPAIPAFQPRERKGG